MMKTLILNGSPNENGDTIALLHEFTKHLCGEIVTLSYKDAISPCVDCRRCRTHPRCALQDQLLDVYPFLEACDNIVLASPVWFSQPSGVLLNLASRLVQPYFCARHFRGETPALIKKHSVLILVGAEPGTEGGAYKTLYTLLKFLNARPVTADVYSMNTDQIPAAEDAQALSCAREAALLLNRLYDEKGAGQ